MDGPCHSNSLEEYKLEDLDEIQLQYSSAAGAVEKEQ